jgi:hypothetical protein
MQHCDWRILGVTALLLTEEFVLGASAPAVAVGMLDLAVAPIRNDLSISLRVAQ